MNKNSDLNTLKEHEGQDISKYSGQVVSSSFDDFGIENVGVESPFGNWFQLFPKEQAIPDEEVLDELIVSIE